MASSNNEKTMEYDKKIYKKGEKTKNHLAGRVNKFQETINQSKTSAIPVINSVPKLI